jgi:hypothetical protein
MAGADSIVLESMYPAAPAIMQPTNSPMIMEIFLRNGEPNISVRMMDTKERNPRPMNSGEPHGKGRLAKIVGHKANMPVSGLEAQSFDPPPQFGIPEDPMSDAPIKRMTVPVTIGGKIFLRIRGGMKDIPISRKEHIKEVPSSIPYASGHAPLVTVPSSAVVEGHVPSRYIASKIYK